ARPRAPSRRRRPRADDRGKNVLATASAASVDGSQPKKGDHADRGVESECHVRESPDGDPRRREPPRPGYAGYEAYPDLARWPFDGRRHESPVAPKPLQPKERPPARKVRWPFFFGRERTERRTEDEHDQRSGIHEEAPRGGGRRAEGVRLRRRAQPVGRLQLLERPRAGDRGAVPYRTLHGAADGVVPGRRGGVGRADRRFRRGRGERADELRRERARDRRHMTVGARPGGHARAPISRTSASASRRYAAVVRAMNSVRRLARESSGCGASSASSAAAWPATAASKASQRACTPGAKRAKSRSTSVSSSRIRHHGLSASGSAPPRSSTAGTVAS